MVKLLGIVTLVLVLVLFPPAVLAVISNNAIPGDTTYPIKRGLEDVIYAVASLNPSTQALFAKARSDRRFQEITVLLTQGKEASNTLNELVKQTQTAADQINQVSDASEKSKLISQLSESIKKYDEGLSRVSQNKQPAPSPIQIPVQTTPRPTITPVATPQPTLSNQEEIDRIRRELEEIRKELEQARQNQLSMQNQIQNQVQNPTPTPTFVQTQVPKPTPSPAQRISQQPHSGISDERVDSTIRSAGDLLRRGEEEMASGSSLDVTLIPTASSSGDIQGIATSSLGIFSRFFLILQNLFD